MKQILKVNAIGVYKSYAKGEVVFLEEDRANGFYIVVEGKIKIFKISTEGREQILHIYGSGNLFGEVPVFSGGNFPANATALEQSNILFLARDRFLKLVTDNPLLSMNMLAELSSRLRQFTLQIENLSLKEISGRLASYLIYLAKKQGNKKNVRLDMSKGKLAGVLGTTPETLSRVFAKMSTRCLIHVAGGEIEIMSYDAVAELARSGKL